MHSLYCIAYFAIIVAVSTAMPSPRSASRLVRRAPVVRQLPSRYAEGSITCVEPGVDGQVWRFSPYFNHLGTYGHTDDDEVLEVEIEVVGAQQGPVNIELLVLDFDEPDGGDRRYPFFGAISRFDPAAIDVGLRTDCGSVHDGRKVMYVALGATAETSPRARPALVRNSATDKQGSRFYAESAIWRYEPESRHLKPQWIHTNGSTTEYRTFYDRSLDQFMFTATVSELHPMLDDVADLRECRLTFNPFAPG